MDTIKINDFQRQELIKHYESELENLNKKKREIIDLLSQLHGKPYLEKQKEENKSPLEDRNFTWKSLVYTILREKDEFLTTEEIFKVAIEKHPELTKVKRRSVVSSLSGGLSQQKRHGVIDVIENPLGKGNFWGLKKWFEDDKPKYEYIEKLEEKGHIIEVNENMKDLSKDIRIGEYIKPVPPPPIKYERHEEESETDDLPF